MATSIQLPDTIVAQLQARARRQHQSVEELAVAILHDALTATPSDFVEDIVATIQATPPDPRTIRPAQGSLADALRPASSDQDFNLQQWNAEWEAVEAEMRAVTRTNDVAEAAHNSQYERHVRKHPASAQQFPRK